MVFYCLAVFINCSNSLCFCRNDDMLRANCLANKSDVSKENQAQDGNLLVKNTLLKEELQKISKKLDEQKAATMAFAGKDIENQR